MAVTSAISDLFSSFYELLASILGAAYSVVHGLFMAVFNLVTGVINLVGDFVGGLINVTEGVAKFALGKKSRSAGLRSDLYQAYDLTNLLAHRQLCDISHRGRCRFCVFPIHGAGQTSGRWEENKLKSSPNNRSLARLEQCLVLLLEPLECLLQDDTKTGGWVRLSALIGSPTLYGGFVRSTAIGVFLLYN